MIRCLVRMSFRSCTHNELIKKVKEKKKLEEAMSRGRVPALYQSSACIRCRLNHALCFPDYVHNSVSRVSLHLRVHRSVTVLQRASCFPASARWHTQRLFSGHHLSCLSGLSSLAAPTTRECCHVEIQSRFHHRELPVYARPNLEGHTSFLFLLCLLPSAVTIS